MIKLQILTYAKIACKEKNQRIYKHYDKKYNKKQDLSMGGKDQRGNWFADRLNHEGII